MTVGAEGDAILGGQQDLAGDSVHRRHLPLREEPRVIQSKAVIGLEKRNRGRVVLRARHDVER